MLGYTAADVDELSNRDFLLLTSCLAEYERQVQAAKSDLDSAMAKLNGA